ncbi:zinc finger, C2H2 type [Teladorsagia circumcincta]|uniref:Zinc finger, C2H2 type n=2 Tax=Teladorsagia circumcincta TaxID=45464 RepID=A0A2G9U351_TELCI|nr:zinc finger, C2H2 type [Teladorsagia circumcincta]
MSLANAYLHLFREHLSSVVYGTVSGQVYPEHQNLHIDESLGEAAIKDSVIYSPSIDQPHPKDRNPRDVVLYKRPANVVCSCYLCGMEMVSLEQLQRHLAKHTEKWTRCPFCYAPVVPIVRDSSWPGRAACAGWNHRLSHAILINSSSGRQLVILDTKLVVPEVLDDKRVKRVKELEPMSEEKRLNMDIAVTMRHLVRSVCEQLGEPYDVSKDSSPQLDTQLGMDVDDDIIEIDSPRVDDDLVESAEVTQAALSAEVRVEAADAVVDAGSGLPGYVEDDEDDAIECITTEPSPNAAAGTAVVKPINDEAADDELKVVAEVEYAPGSSAAAAAGGREKRFKCPKCSSSFITSYALKTHEASAHSTDAGGICDKVFGVPVRGFFFICRNCCAAFESQQQFKLHRMTAASFTAAETFRNGGVVKAPGRAIAPRPTEIQSLSNSALNNARVYSDTPSMSPRMPPRAPPLPTQPIPPGARVAAVAPLMSNKTSSLPVKRRPGPNSDVICLSDDEPGPSAAKRAARSPAASSPLTMKNKPVDTTNRCKV